MKKCLPVLLVFLLLTACGVSQPPSDQVPETGAVESSSIPDEIKSAKRDIFAMDTYMTITCYGDRCEEAADAAEAEIQRLDTLLSVGNPESEISKINESGEGVLSEDSKIMLEESLKIFRETEGAFDITVYPLMVLWGFTSEDYHVPENGELENVLSAVGSEKLVYQDGAVRLAKGQGIDLGGIAKGYTSDRLMEIFTEHELSAAIISLGGNVQLYKTKPDGSFWKCGIQDPNQADEGGSLLGVLEAEDCAVITSGAYERFFKDENGETYHHILDPATGRPAFNGLKSVTIVSDRGILADALSTACYVMGLEKSIDFWRSGQEDFDMILMTDADEVYVTEGIAEQFSANYPMQMITK